MTVSVFVSVSVIVMEMEATSSGSPAESIDVHEHGTRSERVWDITMSVVTVMVTTVALSSGVEIGSVASSVVVGGVLMGACGVQSSL